MYDISSLYVHRIANYTKYHYWCKNVIFSSAVCSTCSGCLSPEHSVQYSPGRYSEHDSGSVQRPYKTWQRYNGNFLNSDPIGHNVLVGELQPIEGSEPPEFLVTRWQVVSQQWVSTGYPACSFQEGRSCSDTNHDRNCHILSRPHTVLEFYLQRRIEV